MKYIYKNCARCSALFFAFWRRFCSFVQFRFNQSGREQLLKCRLKHPKCLPSSNGLPGYRYKPILLHRKYHDIEAILQQYHDIWGNLRGNITISEAISEAISQYLRQYQSSCRVNIRIIRGKTRSKIRVWINIRGIKISWKHTISTRRQCVRLNLG